MAHPKPPIWELHFGPAQKQMLFLTVMTADSDLEIKSILKLDEKLDKKTGVQNGRPTTARGPRPLSKTRGCDQVVTSNVAPTPQDQGGSRSPWDPEQRPKSLVLAGRAVEMLIPPKPADFGHQTPPFLARPSPPCLAQPSDEKP